MDQPEPTLADVIKLIEGVETRLSERIGSLDKKIDDLAGLVQAMAKGHNERFSVIEERLGIEPPRRRGSEGWKPELLG